MTKKLTSKGGDAAPLSKETLAQMRPLAELDPEFLLRFKKEKAKRGRPEGRSKAVVSISLDADILAAIKAGGKGWQTRLNALLRAVVGLQGQ